MSLFGLFDDKDPKKSHEERVTPTRKEKKHLQTCKWPAGHQIFSYDPSTDVLRQIEVKVETSYLLGKGVPKIGKVKRERKAWVNPDEHIFSALNLKNAQRRVQRFKDGLIDQLANLEAYQGREFFDRTWMNWFPI